MRPRRRAEGPTFAIANDGAVYMSVLELDDLGGLDDAIRVALSQDGAFVGIKLTSAERRRLARHVRDAGSEAAGYIAGARRWQKK